MLLYILKCRKNTESKNPKILRTKNGRIMLLSKCTACDSKKASRLLSCLEIKTPLKNTFSRYYFVLEVLTS